MYSLISHAKQKREDSVTHVIISLWINFGLIYQLTVQFY